MPRIGGRGPAALGACVDQVQGSQIDAIAITHQRETFVPVDADGTPIRNAIMWNDERSAAQVAASNATLAPNCTG